MRVLICVEGGGESNATSVIFRNNFAEFFAKALPQHHLPKIQACGGRDDAIAVFNRAIREQWADIVLLLVDSDGPVAYNLSPKEYLHQKVGGRAVNAEEEQVHLMVQCMEAWFLADPAALAAYYGPAVKKSRLLRRSDVEQINDAEARLRKIAKRGGKEYLKRHGFVLIGMVNPDKVRAQAKHCDRLLRKLEQELERRS